MNINRIPKMLSSSLVAAAALAIASTVSASPVTVSWGNLQSTTKPKNHAGNAGMINFNGAGSFSFSKSSSNLGGVKDPGNGFAFEVASANDSNGDYGFITGSFNLGAISGDSIAVSDVGTPTITFWDTTGSASSLNSANSWTADLHLDTLTMSSNNQGAAYGIADDTVTFNLVSATTYTGSDAGLITLMDSNDLINFSFTMSGSHTKSLSQLKSGSPVSDSWTAQIAYGVPDTGATLGLVALGLAAVGIGAISRRRQSA
ncbi:MAG TPA: hypothetical protein VGL42_06450 [Opitutaceae bacterium]|jgi:hypothetical protein